MYRKMLDAVRDAEISGNNLDWTNWTSEQFYNDFLDSLENKYEGIFDYYTKFEWDTSTPTSAQHQQKTTHYKQTIVDALKEFDNGLVTG